MPAVFVDANIPMYLVGAPHPNRERAVALVERCVRLGERLVTDAEVLQEILHRYTAIDRREQIAACTDVLLAIVDEVLPITRDDVLDARLLLGSYPGLSARDAVHIAVMRRAAVPRVLTFDAGFDRVPGIERLA